MFRTRWVAACAVALASLVLAPAALAHHPVGSATQYCDGEKIKLSATFDNPGFEGTTQVTATDSQSGEFGSGSAPATFTTTFNVIERVAGTVSLAWTASDGDSGTVLADYGAVSGCEAPPPPTTTTTTTPPPPPSGHTHIGGPPATASGRSSPPSSPPTQAPPGVQGGELPFSGYPLVPLLATFVVLVGVGLLLRRRTA